MKISKLIQKLQLIQQGHGDIDCAIEHIRYPHSQIRGLTARHLAVSNPKTEPKLVIKRYV